MADISASAVKQLREMTGAGMMDCKNALAEADGDIEKAVDILRTKGLAALAKKAGRATNEGAIAAFVTEDGKTGALVEVNCETDFVGRNEQFQKFVTEMAEHVAQQEPGDVAELKSQQVAAGGLTVEQVLGEVVSKLGENMAIARFVRHDIEGTGSVASYIHGGGRIGVLAEFAFGTPGTADSDTFKTFAKDIAMQIAASQPDYATRDDVPASVVEHELEIYKAQAAESGKPEEIQEKMAQGRLEKYYKEVVLAEQPFVKDPDITVEKYTADTAKALGDSVKVVGFSRLVLGQCGSDEG
jgi:elongation factor Ts